MNKRMETQKIDFHKTKTTNNNKQQTTNNPAVSPFPFSSRFISLDA
jgi:hypothetical protein